MAMLDYTLIAKALKELYPQDAILDYCFKNHPFLATIPKSSSLGGKSSLFPIKYAPMASASSSLTSAQTLAGGTASAAPKYENWLIRTDGTYSDIKKDYVVVRLDNLTLELINGDKKAFINEAKLKMDAMWELMSNRLNCALMGDGTGSLGAAVVSSTSTVLTFSVANAYLINRFEVGQRIDCIYDAASVNDLAHADEGDTIHITAINRSPSVRTITGTRGAQIGAGHLTDARTVTIYPYGGVPTDTNTYATQYTPNVLGWQAWVPTSAPSSAAFYGVDRTVDSRLYGQALDASAYSSRIQAIMDACLQSQVLGGSADRMFVHPKQFFAIMKELEGAVQYTRVAAQGMNGQSSANIGFEAIKVCGVDILQDKDIPPQAGFLHKAGSFELLSAGAVPHIIESGLTLATEDGIEIRGGWYGNTMMNSMPAEAVNITFAS